MDDLFGEVAADESGAEREDVGVVVFATVEGGDLIVAEGGTDARDFVGGHATANARAVDDNAPLRSTISNVTSNGVGDVGVIHGVVTVGAAVDDLVASGFDGSLELFFKGVAPMIGTEGEGGLVR